MSQVLHNHRQVCDTFTEVAQQVDGRWARQHEGLCPSNAVDDTEPCLFPSSPISAKWQFTTR